jgi:glutamyl-tRNA(Gln) amidotransferase subunit E
MLKAKIVNEIHVMRKSVIDGSTPFGFQRTAIAATDGEIQVRKKTIPIQTICLEEDACRKIREKNRNVVYRLDRLGIPLIEVVTAPIINTPEEAKEVA